jgi:hypothetical protein
MKSALVSGGGLSGPESRVSCLPSSRQANEKEVTHAQENSLRAFLLGLAFVLGLCVPTRAWAYSRASVEVDIGLFYKDLAPYGSWVASHG